MIAKRLFALLFLSGVSCGAISAATETDGSQVPDPEQAWGQRDLGAVRDWLAERDGNGPDSVEALRARAWLARRAGDSRRALELIDRAVERAPDQADLRVDRASFRSDLLEDAGTFKSLRIARDVRDDLEHAVAVSPGHVDALAALTAFHQQAPGIAGGSEREAEALLARLQDLAPERVHLRAAMQLAAEARLADAVEQMSRAIDMAGRPRAEWFVSKGRWLLELAQTGRAMRCFERALDAAPGFRPALYEIGRLAAEEGVQSDKGAAALKRYLELPQWPGDPDEALAWLHLGTIQARLGRAAEARIAFERALELDPDLGQARQGLDELAARMDVPAHVGGIPGAERGDSTGFVPRD
ncbi:MAG: tetratricopeptide repeat protein [Wenzhouxiangellaceae bacterium]|nr:tetratricopeptide repeat protein [Wenzhouxiangellaceae bacterium]MBS3822643.1 tetratricopeptide repeat protein [Wenzhouxiangellaceae bacterium]